ncbi:MAG: hypothetical protein QQN41_11590, partial [Nitrosopumilus sp.]
MNKIFILLGILLFLPVVLAVNENGKITAGKDLWIIDMDVKVDGRTSRNLEYGEDITKEANPNSKIEFDIEIKNNHTGLTMEDVSVFVTLDDLELEDISSEIDISPSNDRNFDLEFTLSSAEEGEYDILIEVEGEINNSMHRVKYELTLIVV